MTSRSAVFLPVFLAIAFVVAGCSTVTGPSEDSRKKAAQLNAQLGANYLRQGNLEQANEKLGKALRQDDENADAHSTFALLQMELGKPDVARRHFREALSLAPEDPELHNNYGTFLCEEGEYDTGVEHLLRAAEDRLYNTPAYAYANAGVCAVDAGQADEARRYLRKALEIRSRLPSALRELASLEYNSGRPESARGYLERYHEMAQPSAASLLLASRVERRLGNRELAEDYGRKLLRNFPDSDEAERFLEER